MSEKVPVTLALALIADLCFARGVTGINALPGCHEFAVDEHWWVAVNGHGEPVACSHGPEVPPYSAYVEWNGWPGGIFNRAGGAFAAGSAANEDAFIAALEKAIKEGAK